MDYSIRTFSYTDVNYQGDRMIYAFKLANIAILILCETWNLSIYKRN